MAQKVSQEVFGCWSKACAPPPAGKGGSLKGNHWSNRQRVAAKKKRNSHFDKPLEEQLEIEKKNQIAKGKAAVARHDARTKRPSASKATKNDPMVKKETKYDKYVSQFKSGSKSKYVIKPSGSVRVA